MIRNLRRRIDWISTRSTQLLIGASVLAACSGSTAPETAPTGADPVVTATSEVQTTVTTVASTTTEDPRKAEFASRPLVDKFSFVPGQYRAGTVIDIYFEIPEHMTGLQKFSNSEWYIDITQPGSGEIVPGLWLGVAEDGATIETVSRSITNQHTDKIQFQQEDGTFRGRQAIVLSGESLTEEVDPANANLIFDTGEASRLASYVTPDRQYLIYLFDIDGRVAIAAIDAPQGELDDSLAYYAPVLDSLVFENEL